MREKKCLLCVCVCTNAKFKNIFLAGDAEMYRKYAIVKWCAARVETVSYYTLLCRRWCHKHTRRRTNGGGLITRYHIII